jgi:hypothetical protein
VCIPRGAWECLACVAELVVRLAVGRACGPLAHGRAAAAARGVTASLLQPSSSSPSSQTPHIQHLLCPVSHHQRRQEDPATRLRLRIPLPPPPSSCSLAKAAGNERSLETALVSVLAWRGRCGGARSCLAAVKARSARRAPDSPAAGAAGHAQAPSCAVRGLAAVAGQPGACRRIVSMASMRSAANA